MKTRKPYPTDVSDEEGSFVAPSLCLLPEEVGQLRHDLREVFNAREDLNQATVRTNIFASFPPLDYVC